MHESLVHSSEIIRSDESQHAVVAKRLQAQLAAENVHGSGLGEGEARLAVRGLVEAVGQLHHVAQVFPIFPRGVLVEEEVEAAADEREDLVLVGSLQHVPHGGLRQLEVRIAAGVPGIDTLSIRSL